MFKPSPYQQAVFNFITDGRGSAIIEAVAGSGKTTTIVKALEMIPNNQSVIMLAFNKSIADELAQRVNKPNIEIRTFHSLGFGAYRSSNYGKKILVENNKISKIIDDYLDWKRLSPGDIPGLGYVNRMVSLAKSMGIGAILPNDHQTWMNMADHHDIGAFEESLNVADLIPMCMEILERSNNMPGIIDFNDMIYMPVLRKSRFKSYDWVFVDEAQDVSQIQRQILRSILKPSGRLVAVGDPCQAIYGFRGADSTSLSGIQSDFNCQTLPLSISYRCSKNVILEAQNYVTHIESSETAPDGSVTSLVKYTEADFSRSDAILCRNVAPLVKMAYGLISRSIPINMIGRDIGKGLISLIKSLRPKDMADLDTKLTEWCDREISKLSAKEGNESKIEAIQDRVDCIKIFIEQSSAGISIPQLISHIESFFSDDKNGNLTLATCHKSKGLEWDKVFILDRSRFFPKWARKEWMKEQEKNLVYVAITRAKHDLVYISSDSWKG